MSDDKDSKTEEPTGRRLDDARGKGQVATSREVNSLIMLLAMLVVIMMVSPMMSRDMVLGLRRFLELPHQIHVDDGNFHALMLDTTMQLASTLVLPLFLLLLAALASGVLQNGLMWVTSGLAPDLSRLNPMRGLMRFLSVRNVVELGKSLVKLAIIGTIATIVLMPVLGIVDQYVSTDLAMLLPMLLSLTIKLLVAVIGVMVAMAGIDYAYQKYEHIKSLKMSKQEVKDEAKQMDGDPVIKSRLRSIRAQRARQRMMQAVPTATVVVTNPTHFAVALKYEQGMNAPVLVAKGVEILAHRIRDVARQNFVPIVENPPLARTLYASVEIDQEVPREHYKAVAEVIGYVMRLKKNAIH